MVDIIIIQLIEFPKLLINPHLLYQMNKLTIT
jgi:hypothetical protein